MSTSRPPISHAHRLWDWPVHLGLLPLFFICYSWKQSHYFFHWDQGIGAWSIGSISLMGIAYLLYAAIYRNRDRAAWMASLAGIIFLHYAHLYAGLADYDTLLSRHRFLIPLLAGIFFGIGWLVKRYKGPQIRITHYLNALFLVLSLFEIGQGIHAMIRYQAWWSGLQETYVADSAVALPAIQHPLPNVYHIILDAHTSYESLSRHWEYEDTILQPALTQHGFFLAGESTSEFTHTVQAMSAIFEMDRISFPGLEESDTSNTLLWEGTARTIIRNGKVPQLFQTLGYELVNLSIFDWPASPRFCDSDFIGDPEQTANLLWRRTLGGQLWWDFLRPRSYESDQKILDQLLRIPDSLNQGPHFVYAHLAIPHAPYYFDRSGTLYPVGKQEGRTKQDAYLEHLIYGDKLIADFLDTWIPTLSAPSIVIIQGDHGFRFLENSDTRPIEAHSILNTWYITHQDYSSLSDSISSLDTYQIVLDVFLSPHVRN